MADSLWRSIGRIGGADCNRIFGVFAFYGDDSEQTGSSIVAVGGYFASEEQWEQIEVAVVPVYEKFGITIFHAMKFHNAKGEFKGWSGEQRGDFLEELFQSVKDYIECGVCVCASKSTLKAMKKANHRVSSLSPFGLAFAQLANMTCNGDRLPSKEIPRPVAFVMESGSQSNGEFVRAFHKLTSGEKGYAENFQSLSFARKDSCKAIQLADFFAFYGRKYGKFLFDNQSYDYAAMPFALRVATKEVSHCINVMRGMPVGGDRRNIVVGPNHVFYLGPATRRGGV